MLRLKTFLTAYGHLLDSNDWEINSICKFLLRQTTGRSETSFLHAVRIKDRPVDVLIHLQCTVSLYWLNVFWLSNVFIFDDSKYLWVSYNNKNELKEIEYVWYLSYTYRTWSKRFFKDTLQVRNILEISRNENRCGYNMIKMRGEALGS